MRIGLQRYYFIPVSSERWDNNFVAVHTPQRPRPAADGGRLGERAARGSASRCGGARHISYGTHTLVGPTGFDIPASVIDACRLRGASTTTLAAATHAAGQGFDAPAMPSIPEPLLTQ